jgi:hypothetical protein
VSPIAYVNPSTFVAGNVLTAAQQNVLANNDRFFHGPPSVKVRRASNQTIATASWTAISWSSEVWDNDSMWSSTAATIVDINTAGKYLISAGVEFAASTLGTFRGIGIRVAATTGVPTHGQVVTSETGDVASIGITNMLHLTSTQRIRIPIIHNNGVNSTSVNSRDAPYLNVLWISS